MGAAPLTLRCPACVRRQRWEGGVRTGPPATNLRHLACEVRPTQARARRAHGAAACHRATVECLDCGRTFVTVHHRFAVPHRYPGRDGCRCPTAGW